MNFVGSGVDVTVVGGVVVVVGLVAIGIGARLRCVVVGLVAIGIGARLRCVVVGLVAIGT